MKRTEILAIIGGTALILGVTVRAGEKEASLTGRSRADARPQARLVMQRIPPDLSRAPVLVQRRALQVSHLREMIMEKLELTEEQKRAVDKHFNDFVGEIAGLNPRHPRALAPGEEPTEKWLRDSAVMAKFSKPPGELIERVKAELDEQSRERVEAIVQRWDTIYVRVLASNPLALLRLAVVDPALEVSDQTREEMHQFIREAVESVAPGKPPRDKLQKAAHEARDKMLAKLSPEQREHFVATLKLLDEDRARENKEGWVKRKPIPLAP